MDEAASFHIDTAKKFPHLSRAPITEAVVEIRGRASIPWNKDEIIAKLKELLNGYPDQQTKAILPNFSSISFPSADLSLMKTGNSNGIDLPTVSYL
ncbi:MAG TPA: hypothetical protein VGR15_02915 [Bacteroidota bacterium]|jgi:hypothetical protein|nr:hypothetical protein [Bacteroidota bacterium]